MTESYLHVLITIMNDINSYPVLNTCYVMDSKKLFT